MRKSTTLTTLGVALILGGLSLPFIAYVATCLMPRKYTSHATVLAKSPHPHGNDNASPGPESKIIDPMFGGDQADVLRTRAILDPVIDELHLVDKWSAGQPAKLTHDQAYSRLAGMIDVKQVRDTDLLTIAVTGTDRGEAAEIANTIASTYEKLRSADVDKGLNGALMELQMEVDKQREKVDQAQKELQRLRIRDNILDPNPDAAGLGEEEAEREYLAEERKLNEAKTKTDEQKALLDKINAMSPEEAFSSFPMFNIDSTTGQLLPAYKQAQAERARLIESGLGVNNPKIKVLDAQIQLYKKQIDDEVDSIKKNLQSRYEAAVRSEAAEQKLFDAAKERVQQTKNQSTDYLHAKQDYLDARKVYLDAEAKFSAEKTAMQNTFKTAIIDRAAPPSKPSAPNVTLYIIVSTAVGLFFALCGAGLLAAGRRATRSDIAPLGMVY